MHFRRYALVAAGMLATGVIITAPMSGATWQDNQQGKVSISVTIPQKAVAPTSQSVDLPSSRTTVPATTVPPPRMPVPVTPSPSPPVTPTKDATPPSKEPSVDATSNTKEPVKAKSATEPLGPFVTATPSSATTPSPSTSPAVGDAKK